MSQIILGTMDISDSKYISSIKTAKETGYKLIDTAWIYGNEDKVGQALKEIDYNINVQTKIWTSFYKDISSELGKQLDKLGLKSIYSVLLHRPSINFNETISAWKQLIQLQKKGIIKKIGVSNFDKDMIEILIKETGVKPWCNQIELSVLNYRDDRIYYCKKQDIEIQAWSPMGKDNLVTKNKVVIQLAQKYNTSVFNIALSYLTTQNINVVVKSENEVNIINNFKNQNLKITSEEIERLKKENIYLNKFEETYPY